MRSCILTVQVCVVIIKLTKTLCLFTLLVLSLALSNCASTEKKETNEIVLYPPQPNPPRIQYLTTLSGPEDLIDDKTSFSSFIMGKEGSDSALVVKPYGVSIADGIVYVVDIRGPGYAYFDLKNKKFDIVYGALSGKMYKPINISIDKDGTKYITDTIRSLILVYGSDNKFIKIIGDGKAFKPSDVLIVDDKLYVTDLIHHQLHILDKISGDIIQTIGSRGSENGQLYFPTNLALGPNNHIYVSESGNFRVQEFTLKGAHVKSYGKVGTGLGNFARPKGIAIDRDGRMHVVDGAFENVQILDKEGKLLMFYGETGSLRHNINLPADIVVDYENVKYFSKYADPKFKVEYIILVASQFGASKVNVYGFGKMDGYDYSVEAENK